MQKIRPKRRGKMLTYIFYTMIRFHNIQLKRPQIFTIFSQGKFFKIEKLVTIVRDNLFLLLIKVLELASSRSYNFFFILRFFAVKLGHFLYKNDFFSLVWTGPIKIHFQINAEDATIFTNK